MICPTCKLGEWPDITRGRRVCPNCLSTVRCTKDGAFVAANQPHRFSTNNNRRYRAKLRARDEHRLRRLAGIRKEFDPRVISQDGIISCSCCEHPTTILDSVDGRLDGNGLMRVDIEVEHNGIILTESRVIPQNVRGRFCRQCVLAYPVRPIGRMAVGDEHTPGEFRFNLDARQHTAELRPFRKRSGHTQKGADRLRYSATPSTWMFAFDPRDVDPDPTWAHSGDPSWLASVAPIYDDDRATIIGYEHVGKHPPLCGCVGRCKRHRLETDIIVLPPQVRILAFVAPVQPLRVKPPSLPLFGWTPQRHQIWRGAVSLGSPLAKPRCKHGLEPSWCSLCCT